MWHYCDIFSFLYSDIRNPILNVIPLLICLCFAPGMHALQVVIGRMGIFMCVCVCCVCVCVCVCACVCVYKREFEWKFRG